MKKEEAEPLPYELSESWASPAFIADEMVKAKQALHKQAVREAQRRWYAKNKDTINAERRAERAEGNISEEKKEKKRALQRQYYAAKQQAQGKEYTPRAALSPEEKKERINAYYRMKRAEKKAAKEAAEEEAYAQHIIAEYERIEREKKSAK